jgi:hypothetical protein
MMIGLAQLAVMMRKIQMSIRANKSNKGKQVINL